jgi:hypothetical protein
MTKGDVYVKVWQIRPGETMVAVCDCDVMGKKITEGKLVLDVCRDFYGEEKIAADAAIDLLKRATVANLVGKDAVEYGIEAGLIHREAVISVGGVQHAQFILI